jgi:hypothetical protein
MAGMTRNLRSIDPAVQQQCQLLEQLVDLLQRGARHCEVLACGLPESRLRNVFARIAEAKAMLAARVTTRPLAVPGIIGADAIPPPAHLYSEIHRIYARWLAQSPGAGQQVMDANEVAELMRAEDRLLQQFEAVLQAPHSADLRNALKRYLPQIEACHAELRQWLAAREAARSTLEARNAGRNPLPSGSTRRNGPAMDQQPRRST